MSLLLTFGLGSTAPPAPPAGGDFESALVARLNANPALSALLDGRIFPVQTPQHVPRTGARLLYAVTDNNRPRSLSGAVGIATARVSFDVRSPHYSDCKIGQELLRQYDGFRGVLAGSVTVLFTQLDTHADAFEWPDDGSDEGMQHLSLALLFKYRESLPVAP